MTLFTVLDDTHRHLDLRDRISTILRTVAPLVQETTALPLPPEVRFRLLTPSNWRKESLRDKERLLAQDVLDLGLAPEEGAAVSLQLKAARVFLALVWPMVGGETHVAADGQSETIIAARALHHIGLLAAEPCLYQLIAHELTHHLQMAAHSATVWDTFFPDKRGITAGHRGISTFLEGHARWTDRQVTAHLFGAQVDFATQARRSWRCRLTSAIPGIRKAGPSSAAYETGARLIAHAVGAHGIDLANRVWKDPDLLPTAEEAAAPETWCQRIAG
ncbi:zinc-dependent metalloprotease [Streptomyces sp. NPDC005648]|uniref:zinc-dependent metalloprotease n=1 Tax=Streptomyces sp. NPDC005648 TaxID=3157044 RepID=UPI0033A233B1